MDERIIMNPYAEENLKQKEKLPKESLKIYKGKEETRLTDTGNAEKIAVRYGNNIRFDHRRKRWLIWNVHRWQPDTDGIISRFAIECARERYKEAAEIDNLQTKN